MIIAVMDIIYGATKLPVVLFLGLMGLYLLYNVFRERLMHRPYLTITDECIVINRKRHKEITIRFDEIKSFEQETMTIFKHTRYTGYIIVHLKKDNFFVRVINADDLAIKQQILWDMLNERLGRNLSSTK